MPRGRTIISAFTALAGLLLLTCDFRHFGFNPGDLFALGNALFFSLYLAALRCYSGKTDPVQFTFIQHALSTFAFLGMALVFELPRINPAGMNPAVLAILLLSTAISVSTILIQSTAIKYVRPEKATVIYTMEPVTAVLFAYVMLGEKLDGIKALTGCMLILLAIVITVWKKRSILPGDELKTRLDIKLLKAFNVKSDG
jgi:drug/metabolite transporter (DMT)-like permease